MKDLDSTIAGSTRSDDRTNLRAINRNLDLDAEAFARNPSFSERGACASLVIGFVVGFPFGFVDVIPCKP